MTSSKLFTTSSAFLLKSNPVVSSVKRIFSWRRMEQREGSSRFSKGSPPENTIHRTPSFRIESRCGSRSLTPKELPERFFQMSHIKQRQLQELCACTTSTGNVYNS